MKNKTLFITGGGTAGHVYPALAILEELTQEEPHLKLFWLGRRGSFEEDLVKKSPLGDKITFLPIQSGKLRRYFSFSNFTDLFKIMIGFIQSLYLVNKYKPSLIFSKGGFVTVPVLLAGWFSRVPSISHESDLDPGLATKINARFSKLIFVSFEKTKRYFKDQGKLRVVGNPIRSELLATTLESRSAWRENWDIPTNLPLIFVIGGSLGAQQINELIHESREDLTNNAFILHQTGKEIPSSRSENYLSLPFLELNEMAQALFLADIVISRSGAGSLAEFASLGKTMLLIPLIAGSRGDQLRNARYFEEAGASLVLSENVRADRLKEMVNGLLASPEKCEELALNARKLGRPDSASVCVQIIREEFL